ncbi:MAG: sigma-54 dependent transcriptional regulator [Aureliella sp.]
MTAVLLIDDDRSVCHTVSRGLENDQSIEVFSVSNGENALRVLNDNAPSVCLLDVYLGEENGLELFRKIRAIDSKIPVIFITSDTSSETAIQAMHAGAYDYLAKPIDVGQLRQLTSSAIRARELMDQPVALKVGASVDTGSFVGRSKEMIEVYKQIGRVAAQDVTVLVRGESGSGKELVSRALVEHSSRSEGPFVAVNCAAIPDQLLESELFGHEQGAFTGADRRRIGRFEQCDGGTIFLDEIGDMSSMIQGKVLRLLQEQNFERVGGNDQISTDVRVIAATNRPLEEMVEEGEFREDLLYRLNGFMINLPPLRDRREDIPALLEFFMARAKEEMGREDLTGIGPQAFEVLMNYDWPGNVRQLQSVVRQSVLNATGNVVTHESLPDFVSRPQAGKEESAPVSSSPASPEPPPEPAEAIVAAEPTSFDSSEEAQAPQQEVPAGWSLQQFIEERLSAGTEDLYSEVIECVEKELFARVLQETGGNQSRTAQILGITRGKVRDRIANYKITFDANVNVNG